MIKSGLEDCEGNRSVCAVNAAAHKKTSSLFFFLSIERQRMNTYDSTIHLKRAPRLLIDHFPLLETSRELNEDGSSFSRLEIGI